MSGVQRDYYKVLQIDPEADAEVIEAAFQVLSARFHPESDLTGVHEVRLAEISRAHTVLSNPGRRRAYDIERMDRFSPMGPGNDVAIPLGEGEPAEVVAAPRGLGARIQSGPLTETGAPAGSSVLDFGRYAGMTLRDIANEDADYLRWLTRHSSGIRFRGEIHRLLREDPQESYLPPASR